MKKYFLFFILICNSYLIFTQFSDDFSDGDFSKNLSWIGDITRFEIDFQEKQLTKASVLRNGVDKNNNSVSSGIYVVFFEILSDDGFINQYKKVFVLQN